MLCIGLSFDWLSFIWPCLGKNCRPTSDCYSSLCLENRKGDNDVGTGCVFQLAFVSSYLTGDSSIGACGPCHKCGSSSWRPYGKYS